MKHYIDSTESAFMQLIADIVHFDLPFRAEWTSRVVENPASLASLLTRPLCHLTHIGLLPGPGYEFVSRDSASICSEIYLPGEGWKVLNREIWEENRLGDALLRRKERGHPDFGSAPEGSEWHNPDKLTPAQVQTADGWRLCLVGETRSANQEYWKNEWCPSSDRAPMSASSSVNPYITYRTKAPLPQEEQQKFEAWADTYTFIAPGAKQLAFEAWKAAKATK